MPDEVRQYGGTDSWWWNFDAVTGQGPCEAKRRSDNKGLGYDGLVVWKPKEVLKAVYGKNAAAAYDSCFAWARGEESLKDAVSVAVLWACQNPELELASKPAAYVKRCVGRALKAASRREGGEAWEFTRVNGRREWTRKYRVELVDPQGPAFNANGEENAGEQLTALNNPALRSPAEIIGDPEEMTYHPPGRDDAVRAMVAGEVAYVFKKIDAKAAYALARIEVDGYSKSEIAGELRLSRRELQRKIDNLKAVARRLVTWPTKKPA